MLHPSPHQRLPGEPVVDIRGMTCGYEKQEVLTDVTLRIMPGDFVGLLGPSGSGKTTLLRSVLGAVNIYGGEVVVYGVSTVSKRPRVGYVPQLETIDWNFPVTVREVVMMGRTMENRLFPWYRKEEKELADQMMDRLGILQLAGRHIRELSGGQQQRVFLARALAQDAKVYLMDEPFAGVDAATERAIIDILMELRAQGKTILVVHHDLQTVTRYFDWLIMLNMRVVASGPTEEVFNDTTLNKTYGGRLTVLSQAVQAVQDYERGRG